MRAERAQQVALLAALVAVLLMLLDQMIYRFGTWMELR